MDFKEIVLTKKQYEDLEGKKEKLEKVVENLLLVLKAIDSTESINITPLDIIIKGEVTFNVYKLSRSIDGKLLVELGKEINLK